MSVDKNQTRVRLCKHIRSKESFHSDQPMVDDLYHSGIFWCNQTGDGIGPDGSCADNEECSSTRECFE
ncbi:MAG: hypothetical protein COA73_00365 [Candidatus Hydrogenedentota bacterium]|nr:MAG: hypothetical protein COA73_00365 [Candidatus Hydrogenedentota bacterium]